MSTSSKKFDMDRLHRHNSCIVSPIFTRRSSQCTQSFGVERPSQRNVQDKRVEAGRDPNNVRSWQLSTGALWRFLECCRLAVSRTGAILARMGVLNGKQSLLFDAKNPYLTGIVAMPAGKLCAQRTYLPKSNVRIRGR